MDKKIIFDEARNSIIEFFNSEFGNFDPHLLSLFLNRFNDFLNYTEEGDRYKPKLIFTSNIDSLLKTIDKSYMIQVFEDENASNFNKRIKAILPIASNDWCIYVETKESQVRYGLCTALNSIKEKDLLTMIEESEYLKERSEKLPCVIVQCASMFMMTLSSTKGNKLAINFSLDPNKQFDSVEDINNFVNDSFSKLRTTNKKLAEIKTMYNNIIHRVITDVSGAICVVVDKDYEDNGLFEDGIWLQEPISFSKLFTYTKSYSEEKLQAFVQLFIRMLKFDGITIVDNLGRIRAYNIFVDIDNKKAKNIIGGARKRAVHAIINSRKSHILGVYFQSHEGEIFYQSLDEKSKRRRIKKDTAKTSIKEIQEITKELKEKEASKEQSDTQKESQKEIKDTSKDKDASKEVKDKDLTKEKDAKEEK